LKYVDEFREGGAARRIAEEIRKVSTRPHTIMEICGGQTHAIVRFGVDELLPRDLTLVHGPGCPVCVTPIELIDKAIAIASRPGVVFSSFGDMLRVPGSETDLLSVRAGGADVRIVYSPLDSVRLARETPDREVVFFAVGFETTAPANALAVLQARELGLSNFSVLVSHVLVPPAIEAILSSPGNRVEGFLAAGHVCAIMGTEEYVPLAKKYRVPIVVTGFEPIDLLRGISLVVRQLEEGRGEVENAYARTVREDGNPHARGLIRRVFCVVDRKWRGIGSIAHSGLGLTEEFAAFDAETRFDVAARSAEESPECISGLVLQGVKKPLECPAFGSRCSPEHPLGATMVSSEGACAAYYRYRRRVAG
jgi:hydrogenase expression/formation protein HypD